jgi:DUF1680 family protein
MYCTGGQTNAEIWSPPYQLSARLGETTQEHCVVYNMMRLAEYLYRWTGETAYADYWERNLYNGVLAQQHPETGMVAYSLPLRSGSVKKWGTPLDDFWCCHGTLVQAQTMYLDHVFYQEGENVVLSQYIPSQYQLTRHGIDIRLTLEEDAQLEADSRPGSRAYTLQVDCSQPQEFSLLVRLPGWLSAEASVTIDGEKAAAGDPSTYARLHRPWGHNRLRIVLPQKITPCPLPDMPDTIAFMEGPVVLAGILNSGAHGRSVETVEEPALYARREDPAAVLTPDNERTPSRWRIGYRTRGQAHNLRFIPLYEVRDECYAVYFPIEEPRA